MNSLDSLTGKNIPASSNGSLRDVRAHLETTAIVETPCSLSLRGTSGERAGERGTFHRLGAANWNPLSLTLSPLLRRGEGESTSGMVVVSRRDPFRPAPGRGDRASNHALYKSARLPDCLGEGWC